MEFPLVVVKVFNFPIGTNSLSLSLPHLVILCIYECGMTYHCMYLMSNSQNRVIGIHFNLNMCCIHTLQAFKSLLMWDFPLYVINIFYYHWLVKKLLWPMAGQNIARQEIHAEIEEERRQSQRDAMKLY